MKAAEKNVKRKAHYDHLEQSVDADAARRFHEPAAVKSKMTKLASVKIIEPVSYTHLTLPTKRIV